jgi:hypothetical protein
MSASGPVSVCAIAEGSSRATHRRRVGCVGRHQDVRLLPAQHVALEVVRDDHDEIGLAPPQRVLALLGSMHHAREIEIARRFHPRQHRADQRPAVVELHQRRQVARIGIDGKAEQHQLHDRQPDHHGEGDAVAPHLDEFLHQHGQEPGNREQAHAASREKLSRAPVIR